MNEENILIQAGLSQEQASVYQALLEKGPQKASELSKWTGIKRGLIYKVLEQLESMSLISENGGSGTVAVFSPSHPSLLLSNIERKEKEIALTKEMLGNSIGTLSSKYNTIVGKPTVNFYSGTDGIKKIYDDILLTGKNIYLIRPKLEETFNNSMLPIVEDFIKKRIQKNISVIALTPADVDVDSIKDTKLLFDRTVIPLNLYDSPVEINIYGDKIAILSYAKELIGVTIESPQISKALEQLFLMAKNGATK